MVKSKKVKVKSEGNSEHLLEAKGSSGDVEILKIPKNADITVTGTKVVSEEDKNTIIYADTGKNEKIIMPIATETATPYIESNQEIMGKQTSKIAELTRLLLRCPKPEFFKMEDAIRYQDQWNKWKQEVTQYCNNQ